MAEGPVVEKRTAFPRLRVDRSRSTALVLLLLAACGSGTPSSESEPPPPPPVVPTHTLTGVTPAHGTLGSRVVVSGTGFGDDPAALSVTFTGPAQGAMAASIVASAPGSLTVLVPSGVGETVQVTVALAGVKSAPLPFAVDPLVDPTPGAPGSEASSFAAEADALLANVGSVLDGVLAVQLEGSGQAAAAARVRSGVAQLRPAYAAALQTRLAALTPEQLGMVDAVLSTPEMVQARADLVAAAAQLATTPSWRSGRSAALFGGAFDGGTVESIQQVKVFLVKAKATMEKLDTALLVAMVAAGAATAIPGFQSAAALVPVLEEIRESLVKPIIAILDRVIPLMETFPTKAVGRTLVVKIAENDLQLDQGFGSMTDPISAIHGVGAILVLEPYAVRGTISFGNDGGKALRSAGADLAPDLSGVAAALFELADFDVGNIQVDEVEIRLRLISSDPAVVPETSGELLWISAVAPGPVDLVVQGDLDHVAETCPPVGTFSQCIPAETIRIGRSFLSISGNQVAPPATLGPRLDGAQVEGRAPNTAHLGDTVVVTGRGFSRSSEIAHQDIHFEPAPGYPMSGVAYSIHQSLNDYDSFRSEVVDALPGPMTVWIEGHPSNALDFTILPPRLDGVPPSGIAGEFWRITGEGFSGNPQHNQADWAGFRSLPDRGSHGMLELVVPDGGQSGPFKIVTLGVLESNAQDVVVRRFSEPSMLSAPGRTGLRPTVAHDDSNGARIVAWVDRNATGGAQLVASVLPSGAARAGNPVVLPARLGGHPTAPPRPAVAAADGRFFAAWVDLAPGPGAVDRILASYSDDGITWSAPVALSNHAGPSRQPVMAANGRRVVVAWIDEAATSGGDAGLRFRVSADGGATFGGIWSWAGPDATDPTVAVAGNAIAVAWSSAELSGRGIVAVRSEDGGQNFQPPWRLGAAGPLAIARHPVIALGPSCVVRSLASMYVAWEQTAGDAAEDVLFARIDGTIMTQQNVTKSLVHSQSPSLVVDRDCIPALAWLEMGHTKQALL
ncbi:MAG: repeat-like domain, partial [Pseudomonadota bacterium]